VQLVSKISNLCVPDPPTLHTDRQATYDPNTALCTKVHRAVKTVEIMLFTELGVIGELHNSLRPLSYPHHLPSRRSYVRHCVVNRKSSLAQHRWPLRSRDVTGHVDGSVWSRVNASSWHVYNTTGSRLSSILLG